MRSRNAVSFDFTGARVLVTGGTSGIGHGVALAFRAAGAEVTVTGTRPRADDYQVDLSAMSYRRLVAAEDASLDALAGSFDTLDVLVNNAGANFPGGLDEYEPDGFAASVQLNLVAPYRLTRGLYPALKASELPGGAAVVNLSSMAAVRAVPIVPGYSAAKGGINQVTQNLASRWAADGIRVNAVAPGTTQTPMTAPMEAFEPMLQQQLDHIPLGRLASVDDIVPTVLFLASTASSYVTGVTWAVDGGYLTH